MSLIAINCDTLKLLEIGQKKEKGKRMDVVKILVYFLLFYIYIYIIYIYIYIKLIYVYKQIRLKHE